MSEPDFQDDLSEQQEAIEMALNELTRVRAYTLKADEIREFKAAQYALRGLLPDEYGEYSAKDVFDNAE